MDVTYVSRLITYTNKEMDIIVIKAGDTPGNFIC